MSTEIQRRQVSLDFTIIVSGRPLYEDSDGPVYGDYDEATDRMRYGRACNTGFLTYGEVDYDHYLSAYMNIQNLIDEAKSWSRRNGNEVKQ